MKLKKLFLLGCAGFLLACFGLFYILNSSSSLHSNKLDYGKVESKLKVLETAVYRHGDTMKELESLVNIAHDSDTNSVLNPSDQKRAEKSTDNRIIENDGNNDDDLVDNMAKPLKHDEYDKSKVCSAAVGIGQEAKSDIGMLNVYEELPFDDPDGGVWKQGWEIKINSGRFTRQNKLKVFVIPHSHNDPGWIKTFENYYETQTKHILNTMLDKLNANPSLKFIWAEMSFFSLWWNELSDQDKLRVKRIVETKQLEFVTGGWVMPDESSSHYYSMLIQMIEGHQWLLHHLDYIPKNGWAIDPFGMSPTNAYLLKRTGLTNMVIQRTHYAVKKFLASKQELEFQWRQNWDSKGSADILCHMMPFYSYDVPHTCGPDPSICCQFDFKRMRSVSHLSCPWGKPAAPIRPQNVKERSETLLDQYRKKSMLYKTNTLLIPLGDDFRWEDNKEWDAQTSNYEKIFSYINAHEEYNAVVQFATLEDYFASLNEEQASHRFTPKILSGDFFTYADRGKHYWSGYFTSRPFHKAMDRQLISALKSSQVAYTLMAAEITKNWGSLENYPFVRSLLGKIIKSRRSLSLFQHHDGVAGTAKDHVVNDYAKILHQAINDCNHVLQQSLYILTHLSKGSNMNLRDISENSILYNPVISRDGPSEVPHYNLIILDQEITQRIVQVFNPSIRKRTHLVRLYVSTYHVEVTDLEGNKIQSEILPVFESSSTISKNTYELHFLADVSGSFAIKNFVIKYSPTQGIIPTPEILIFNSPSLGMKHNLFAINNSPNGEPIQISNTYITVDFDENGFMKSMTCDGKSHPVHIEMVSYGAQKAAETSGLYLFLPDGPAQPLPVIKPFIKVVKGKYMSYVEVSLTQIKHRVIVYSHPGFEKYAIEVKNLVDVRNERNYELAMKIVTDIESENRFFTDLNGFQMIKRKWFSKLPIQANYYPVPSAAYIESKLLRMTVLSGQPLGGASLKSGEIEIMMDRRLVQDDNRGAGQGCTDNLETMHSFKIMFETPACEDDQADSSPPMLSNPANIQLHDLLNPFQLFSAPQQATGDSLAGVSDYLVKSSSLSTSCDIEFVSAVPLPEYTNPMDDHSFVPTSKSALLFRRVGFDGRFDSNVPVNGCLLRDADLGRCNIQNIFGELFQPTLSQMTLSFIHQGQTLKYNESILMKPMEVYGFLVNFNSVAL